MPTPKSSRQKPQTAAKPKAPLSAKKLYGRLCTQIENGHFESAKKTCDKLLHIDPSDEDAQKARVYLLLQTDRFADALPLVTSSFENAYALYGLHREAEGKDILGDSDNENRGIIHMRAQLSYREGDYQTAVDLYNDLLDNSDANPDEHQDILTNLSAAQKHLDFLSSHSLPPPSIDLENTPPPIAATSALAPAPAGQIQLSARPVRPRPAKYTNAPPPDPERWLKKSERSSFLHGKKRRGGGGATQGFTEAPTASVTASGGGGGGGGKKGKKRK